MKQEDLERLLRMQTDRIISEIRNKKSLDDYHFNVEEAARFLRIAVPTLYTYTSKRLIPFIKSGKKLMFSKQELVKWLDTFQKPALDENTLSYNAANEKKRRPNGSV